MFNHSVKEGPSNQLQGNSIDFNLTLGLKSFTIKEFLWSLGRIITSLVGVGQ